jgi:hypothetical protein
VSQITLFLPSFSWRRRPFRYLSTEVLNFPSKNEIIRLNATNSVMRVAVFDTRSFLKIISISKIMLQNVFVNQISKTFSALLYVDFKKR